MISHSAKETQAIAFNIAKETIENHQDPSSLVFLLTGDLGAGKTTFVQGFIEGLGSLEKAKSPTFTIERLYHTDTNTDTKPIPIHHFDFYRLASNDHLMIETLKELTNPILNSEVNDYIIIEWPTQLSNLPFDHYTEINFKITAPDTREIEITKK